MNKVKKIKNKIIFILILTFYSFLLSVEINDFKWDILSSSTKFRYVEDFYSLYYLPNKIENDDLNRNIFWLKWALVAPFSPPIFALVPPENEKVYQKYKKLIRMHLHYLVTKNLVFLAARFDKHKPVFYNRPYKKEILKSLNISEYLYMEAYKEWKKVINYYNQLKKVRVKTKLNFLEQTLYRIRVQELSYERIIQRKLKKLEKTRIFFNK